MAYRDHWERLGFDSSKCELFISNNMKFIDILVRLFEYTQYFTTEQVKNGIIKLVNKWKIDRKDIPLYVNINAENNKIGSEYWLYTIVKDILPEHNIINTQLLNECIESEIEILSIDDWCLSGVNMAVNTDELLYKHTCKSKINYTYIFYIFTNGCSETLTSVSKSYNISKNILYEQFVEQFNPLLEDNEQNNKLIKEFLETFSPDVDDFSYPVILEYKVANQFGSFPEIYKKCRNFIKPYKSKETL